MSLQILAGAFKGRKLLSPKTGRTRPTLAIMRKALFDVVQDRIEGATILDLFAGSGGIGFEALSRGASHVTFVEIDRDALRCLHENMALLKVEKQCTILGYDVFLALRKLVATGKVFDLIYADPPYAHTRVLKELLHFCDTHPLLEPKGTFFIEEGAPSHLEMQGLNSFQLVNTRKFSDSLLHQFRKLPS
ncbi:MAG: hypothetical protein RLZZ453_757 [Chlamydiota bacterium]|jgi:16S rRNA (guanine(966)-N(2))-methyltransferase RsmD